MFPLWKKEYRVFHQSDEEKCVLNRRLTDESELVLAAFNTGQYVPLLYSDHPDEFVGCNAECPDGSFEIHYISCLAQRGVLSGFVTYQSPTGISPSMASGFFCQDCHRQIAKLPADHSLFIIDQIGHAAYPLFGRSRRFRFRHYLVTIKRRRREVAYTVEDTDVTNKRHP